MKTPIFSYLLLAIASFMTFCVKHAPSWWKGIYLPPVAGTDTTPELTLFPLEHPLVCAPSYHNKALSSLGWLLQQQDLFAFGINTLQASKKV